MRSGDTGQRIPCFDSCQLITTSMCNQFSPGLLKLARECESKHWYACGTDGRACGHVIPKFSRMGRLPHFLSYGPPPTRAWSSAIIKVVYTVFTSTQITWIRVKIHNRNYYIDTKLISPI